MVALRLSQPSRCSQQPLLLLRLSLGNTGRETILTLTLTRAPSLPAEGSSHLLLGMTVRQSPVWASQTRICPARQQLASSIPSLARHSMSCRTGSTDVRHHPGQLVSVFPSGPHHAVAPQQQRGDLTDGWRVAVVITGEVPPPPSAMRRSVLAVVPWAEDPVKAEKQQNQQDPRSQAQSCHPGWEGTHQQSASALLSFPFQPCMFTSVNKSPAVMWAGQTYHAGLLPASRSPQHAVNSSSICPQGRDPALISADSLHICRSKMNLGCQGQLGTFQC